MKKTITLFTLALMSIGAAVAQDTLVVNRDCAKGVQLVKAPITYDYVDLGLSVKWATSNVGAANPWDYGDYFAWGETVGYGMSDPSNAHNQSYTGGSTVKTYYGWDTYKYGYGISFKSLSKYNYSTLYGSVVDNKTMLDREDDAARVNMGGSWRMPTTAEQKELIANCYWEWTDSYNGKGVKGYIVYKAKDASDKGKVKNEDETPTIVGSYSLTDTHIFLPAAGYRRESDLYGVGGYSGYYWSSSLSTEYQYSAYRPYYAYHLYFLSSSVHWSSYGDRCNGLSVRAVVK